MQCSHVTDIWHTTIDSRLSGCYNIISQCHHAFLSKYVIEWYINVSSYIWWHNNRFEINWHPKPTLVLCWILMFFSLWRTSYWYIEDKTYKKIERNPSLCSRKPARKSMHECLYTSETHCGNLQGFCQYIIGRHAKFHNSKI